MQDEKPGYGRPPKATRFKPGHSGNPKGRPKSSRSLKSDLTRLMEKRMSIRQNGEQRFVTGRELMLLKLFERAANGDHKASAQICAMLMKFEAREPTPTTSIETVTDNDRAIIADFLRRNSKEEKSDD